MSEILILCVEDEPEVRVAIERDLEHFSDAFIVEMADDAADARRVIAEYRVRGVALGLILADHVLPGTTGVDLLIELNNNPETASARKVLITGQASHEDTIRAINHAGLDHFIAKPWTPDDLMSVVRRQLTEFVLATHIDVLAFVHILEGDRLLESLRRH